MDLENISSDIMDKVITEMNSYDYNSFSDEDGESDITIILENDNRKIGLLIEDKINSKAMTE